MRDDAPPRTSPIATGQDLPQQTVYGCAQASRTVCSNRKECQPKWINHPSGADLVRRRYGPPAATPLLAGALFSDGLSVAVVRLSTLLHSLRLSLNDWRECPSSTWHRGLLSGEPGLGVAAPAPVEFKPYPGQIVPEPVVHSANTCCAAGTDRAIAIATASPNRPMAVQSFIDPPKKEGHRVRRPARRHRRS